MLTSRASVSRFTNAFPNLSQEFTNSFPRLSQFFPKARWEIPIGKLGNLGITEIGKLGKLGIPKRLVKVR
jgi:hypothetical protein